MVFYRRESWNGLPCSPPGDLPDPRIEPASPVLQADVLPTEPPGKPPPIGTLLPHSQAGLPPSEYTWWRETQPLMQDPSGLSLTYKWAQHTQRKQRWAKSKPCVCAKSPQSCLTLQHYGLWPARFLCLWILQAKILESEKKVKVKSLSHVQLFVTPWIVAHQAPPSMRFSSQEYWSGLPCPSPGDLPNPGIKPRSLALQADSLSS